MRNTFISHLIKSAKENDKIVLIVGDLGYSVVEEFEKQFPTRFYNAGISEQSMASMAAGLASEGFHVFIYSIANFPTFRCAEQIRNDIDYHNLPVTIVSVGSGVGYGHLGYSHHGLQDYALMRSFPNMLIASPGDIMECRACIKYLIKNPQPSYLRLDKSSTYSIHNKIPEIYPGKWIEVLKKNNNRDSLYLTTGVTIKYCLDNFYKKKKYSLYSLPLWGMKHKKNQFNYVKKYKKIIVIEDHFQDGGFQSWLLESLNKKFLKTNIISKSINSKIVGKVGSQEFLMKFLF
jgi:transketolase